jgi:O-antigen/teichoic acid export membrane protein
MITNWAPFVFLGIFATTEETGVFGIAWRLSLLVGMVPMALENIAAPRIAALYAAGERPSLIWLCQAATLAVIAVTLPLATGMVVFRSDIMTLFGAAFETGGRVLLPLVLLRLLMAATGPVNAILLMTGQETTIRNVLFVASCCIVLGNAVLSKSHGALGAAWASGGALAVGQCLAAVLVWRRLGFWSVPLSRDLVKDVVSFFRTGNFRSER